jgi:hypothetical protein
MNNQEFLLTLVIFTYKNLLCYKLLRYWKQDSSSKLFGNTYFQSNKSNINDKSIDI